MNTFSTLADAELLKQALKRQRQASFWRELGPDDVQRLRASSRKRDRFLQGLGALVGIGLFVGVLYSMLAFVMPLASDAGLGTVTADTALSVLAAGVAGAVVGAIILALVLNGGQPRFTSLLEPLKNMSGGCARALEYLPCATARAYRDQVVANGREMLRVDLLFMKSLVTASLEQAGADKEEQDCRALHGVPRLVPDAGAK